MIPFQRSPLAIVALTLLTSSCVLNAPPARNGRYLVDISQMEKADFLHDTWVYQHPTKKIQDYNFFLLDKVAVFPDPVKRLSPEARARYDTMATNIEQRVGHDLMVDYPNSINRSSSTIELTISVIDIKPVVHTTRGGNDVTIIDTSAKGSKLEMDCKDSSTGELVYAISTLLKGDLYTTLEDPALAPRLEKDLQEWMAFLKSRMEKSKAGTLPSQSQVDFVTRLKNMPYQGFISSSGPVGLMDGRWEGDISTSGTKAQIRLIDGFLQVGDLKGDGIAESVVLLSENAGGTGDFYYLGLVGPVNGQLQNISTVLLGDRVEILSSKIEKQKIFVTLVQAGKSDAMCCPGEVVTRAWAYRPEGLQEVKISKPPHRLSIRMIEGQTWLLREMDGNILAKPDRLATLSYSANRFSGSGGCNRYSMAVTNGQMVGEIKGGPIALTKMACAPDVIGVEQDYIERLATVNKFGFMLGDLVLTYENKGHQSTMRFRKKS